MFNMIKKTNKNTCLTRLFIAVLLTLCGTFSAISEETISGNFIQPKDFEPGGQYHLFGSRGSVSKRYDTQFNAVTLSNIKQGILDINTGYFGARVKYDIDLSSYHPYRVHGSFSNSASRNASGKQGVTGLGFTAYQMNYHGYELHPHDAYDGGAGTGARDEYTYTMNGEVVSVSINNSLEKRPTRYEKMTELSKNFSLENVGSGIKKIYTTNPNLNRVGNKAEIINIAATGIVNSLDMGLTALGARDITTAVGIARDEATLRALNALPASSTVKATKVLAGTHEVIDESIYTITSIANDFANNNPNTAEVVKVGTTLVPTAKFIPKKIPKGVSNTAHPNNNFGKNNPNYSAELNQKISLKQDAVEVRAGLPSKLRGGGNVAVADIQISGLSTKKMSAHSGIEIVKPTHKSNSLVGAGSGNFKATYVRTKEGRKNFADNDSEYKILDNLADKLGKNTQASGRVVIYTERTACDSCLGAANQFRQKYPNIDVKIIHHGRALYPNKDLTNEVRNGR